MGIESNSAPVFIVGMPRSGTKLVRNMLAQHSQLRFSAVETEFFPFWVTRWKTFGSIEDRRQFERFYLMCVNLPFFVQNAERGVYVNWEAWHEACSEFTPSGVFDALMRQILEIPADDQTTMWGDKSPSYIGHVPMLLKHFPTSKIVHVIRDVRDCSLSVNAAWGKNMLRFAQRWHDDVSRCRADGNRLNQSYFEFRYEDLLHGSRNVIESVCEFIGLEYEEEMLSLDPVTENYGDARGLSELLTNNVQKYKSKMCPELVAKIEEVTCSTLRALDYPCASDAKLTRVPKWRLWYWQIQDGLNLLYASYKERGLIGACRFHHNYFRTSGNRIR